MTQPEIVVLEDSPDRVYRIQKAVAGAYPLRVFTTAPEFVAWLADPGPVVLLSLDYHLGPRESGTGFDAAEALAELAAPLAPVILHSSDTTGAQAQQAALDDAGYTTRRFPFATKPWAAAYEELVQP